MKRVKRVYEYPRNVPRKLIMAFRRSNQNERELARRIKVNVGHVSKLLQKGIEPKDVEIRKKMMFPKRKRKSKMAVKEINHRPKFISDWLHLPTEERHQAIKKYLNEKEKSK